MAPRRMTLAEAFEVAMIDAINVYVRDVLEPRGYLTPEGRIEIGRDECLQEKYRIAREWAAEWAAFDGYER